MNIKRKGKLSHCKFSDIEQSLPEVTSFSNDMLSSCDVFICALGFEDRAIAIPQEFPSNFNADFALVGKYTTNEPDNDEKERELYSLLENAECTRVCVNADKPLDVSKAVGELISSVRKQKISVVFDISVSSSRYILSVVHALLQERRDIQLTVCYSEPKDYHPQRAEYLADKAACVERALDFKGNQPLHEVGVETVFRNELYPGHFTDSGSNYAIVIPSHRMERTGRCLQNIDDQVMASGQESAFWIFGAPYKEKNEWRADLQEDIAREYVKKFLVDKNEPKITPDNSQRCNTLQYKDIMKVLYKVIDSQLGNRVTIIPNGSKLQMLGVSLVLSVRSECSVMHAKPSHFNPNQYSNGIGAKWVVHFENISQVKDKLSRVGLLSLSPSGKQAL